VKGRTGSETRRVFLGRSARAGAGLVLMSVIPSWALQARRHTRAYRERSFFTMGSVATISAYGESAVQIDQAIRKVIEEFSRLDRLLSIYDPRSELSRINAAAGRETVCVHPEVLRLLKQMRQWSADTEGAFDMTVEPLMRLWGFRDRLRFLTPSDTEIRQALVAVGADRVHIDETLETVGLDHPASLLDSGGWGVGYAVDRAVEILRKEGIESAFVNHSGDARTFGIPDDSEGWIAGIPHPDNPTAMMRSFVLKDCAISTSGTYEKFVELGEKQYGHLMDVLKGIPESDVASMTVVAAESLKADVLSTAAACRPGLLSPGRWDGIRFLMMKRNGNDLNVTQYLDGGVRLHE